MLSAVEHLHHNSISCCNVKSQNCLVDENYRVIFCDFGITQVEEGSDASATSEDTDMQIAPEVFSGGKYGIQADIWTLGVILYQLMYKNTPFVS